MAKNRQQNKKQNQQQTPVQETEVKQENVAPVADNETTVNNPEETEPKTTEVENKTETTEEEKTKVGSEVETEAETEEVKELDPVKAKVSDILKTVTKFEDLLPYKDHPVIGKTIHVLERYINNAYGKNRANGQTVAAANYDLYKHLVAILSEKQYNTFKQRWDVINKLFLVDDRFNPISLSRFDFHWTYGSDSKIKYHGLIEVINSFAHPGKRKAAKARITKDAVANVVPANGVQNIIRYYGL